MSLSNRVATHSRDQSSNGRHMSDTDIWARSTAPQSPFTGRQVGIGIVVAIVLAVVAFGLPLALI